MRALSPVEAAFAFALGGSVLAVMVPAFAKNVHASRMAEPLEGVSRIAARANSLAESAPQAEAYPPSVGLTPARVPRAEGVKDPPGTWDAPTWRLLDFGFTGPHSYSFEFTSHCTPTGSNFEAVAHGDLDGDGVLSTFSLSGSVLPGSTPTLAPLEVVREIE